MSQLQVTGEAKIRDIQGPVIANSGVITALDGAASQYVRGDGTLADFPTSTGGGSSVSYYLNSSVSQGTIDGVAYRELNKEPIIGAGTDITISANGYVASYITDANDPDVLSVPGGNFNCEFYFSVNSDAHNPTFYAELYKYDGTTFTLLGSSQAVPESINQGTTIAPYYFAIPVATAALALTDRLAIRIYVNVDTRTVTLHTENSHLCQVVTTFSKGMVSLNNLTDQSQFITTGTSGTDFNIVSSGDTHTFNLPVASATNTGKLSNTDWTTFNNKQNALTLTTTGTSGAATLVGATLNIPQYQGVLTNPVTGTGTTNTLPKFTGTSAIGNSNITDTGSLITLGSNSYVNGNLAVGANSAPYSERLYIQGDASASNAVITTSANSGISTLSVNIDRGLQGGVSIVADKTNQLARIQVTNSDWWPLVFQVRGADGINERMRITNIGSVGIGATSLGQYNLRISKNITGSSNSFGVVVDGQIQSGVTNIANIFSSNPSTQAATFNIGALVHYNATFSGIGAGNTINNQFGFLAENTLTGATNNFGFYGNIPSGTNRWNIYMAGTAANYLAGALLIGTTNVLADYPLNAQGTANGNLLFRFANTSNGTSARMGLILATDFGAVGSIDAYSTTYTGGTADDTASGVRILASGVGGLSLRANNASGTIRFYNGSTESARFGTNGALGIAATNLGSVSLFISKTMSGSIDSFHVNVNGVIQSDVTNSATYFRSGVSTAAGAFTLANLYHYTTSQGTIGAGSAVTNQYGFFVNSNLTGATNDFGFYGNLAAATNVWNLYMNGTANNYLAGSLGIGSTSLTGYNLRISKNITGNADALGISIDSTIQSDVTTTAQIYKSNVNTAAAAFTLADLMHFWAQQGTIGSTSAVTRQYGFYAHNSLTGAGTNFGFYSNIAAGATNWNFYANGTANNYMAGNLGLGNTGLNNVNLRLGNSITGSTSSFAILNGGTIQSGVTSLAAYNSTSASTVAATFTLTDLHHYRAFSGTFGAGSVVTNQYGFFVDASLTEAANDYGFYGNIGAAANRWNLYMNGTANNYMAGSLGIGATGLGGYTLRASKNITGAIASYGIVSDGTTQSDVTTSVDYFRSSASTQAAAFTLFSLTHFNANQGTIGATSAITNQYGFAVGSSLIGATNNYGFFGNIASGTNRWNLYMAGTAANYMAGNLGIGTTTIGASLHIKTALSTASSEEIALRVESNPTGGTADRQIELLVKNDGTAANTYGVIRLGDWFTNAGTPSKVLITASGASYFRGGNVLIGSTTDSGEQLQVNGTSLFQNAAVGTIGTFRSATVNGQRLDVNSTATGVRLLSGFDTGITGTFEILASGGSSTLIFGTQTTERMRIDNTGSVGIGTTSLTAKLDVRSSATAGSTASPTFRAYAQDADSYFEINNNSSNSADIKLTRSDAATMFTVNGHSGLGYLFGQLGIGVASPNASAKVQIDSTTQGFLPPRMTSAQRAAIATPATGLMVYQTDGVEGVYVYSGGSWKSLTMV